MSDDLEKRLRDLTGTAHSDFTIGDEAADELARLRAENEALTEKAAELSEDCAGWQRECERLREDVRRIDALEAWSASVYLSRDPETTRRGHWVVVDETKRTRRGVLGDTLRGAVDAALNEGSAK